MKRIVSVLRLLVYAPFYLLGFLTALLFKIFKKKQAFGDDKKAAFVEAISDMLEMQKMVSGDCSIEDSKGRLNRKAMGYIYGFIDSALRTIGQDMSDVSIGIPVTYGVLYRLYPGKEDQYTDFLIDHIGNDSVVMSGVMSGGQQYTDLIKHKKSPMKFGMFLLEGDNYDEMQRGDTPESVQEQAPVEQPKHRASSVIIMGDKPISEPLPSVIILPYNPVTPTGQVQPESPVEQPVEPRMNPLPELCQNFLDHHQGVYRNCLLDQIANSIMGWGELGMDSPYPTTAKALRNIIDDLLINAGKLEKAQERLMQMDIEDLDGETLEGLAYYLED